MVLALIRVLWQSSALILNKVVYGEQNLAEH